MRRLPSDGPPADLWDERPMVAWQNGPSARAAREGPVLLGKGRDGVRYVVDKWRANSIWRERGHGPWNYGWKTTGSSAVGSHGQCPFASLWEAREGAEAAVRYRLEYRAASRMPVDRKLRSGARSASCGRGRSRGASASSRASATRGA